MGKQIVLVGQGKKFEIWDETRWQENAKACFEADISKDDLIGDLGSLSF
ncbi:MAG TPA: hypothetical protein ENK06_13710 [Gammaproteobacteria bacterium]|nr:hypothetical protein [Gammaproteobacteria bacterium]